MTNRGSVCLTGHHSPHVEAVQSPSTVKKGDLSIEKICGLPTKKGSLTNQSGDALIWCAKCTYPTNWYDLGVSEYRVYAIIWEQLWSVINGWIWGYPIFRQAPPGERLLPGQVLHGFGTWSILKLWYGGKTIQYGFKNRNSYESGIHDLWPNHAKPKRLTSWVWPMYTFCPKSSA